MILISFTGLVLGIVGLATYRSSGRQFVRGRAQGAWGVALNSILTLVFLGAFAVGMFRRAQLQGIVPDSAPTEVPDVSSIDRIHDKVNNFSLVHPGTNWTNIDPSKFNSPAKLMLGNVARELYELVICEDEPDAIVFDLKTMRTLVKTEMERRSKNVTFEDRPNETNGGMEFAHLTANLTIPSVKIPAFYDIWITIQSGRIYQLMTYGPKLRSKEVSQFSRSMMESFRILKPTKNLKEAVAKQVDVEDHPWGIATKLGSQGWAAWPGARKDFPNAVFAAYHAPDMFVGVVPLPIQSTPIDLTTAANALLGASLGWTLEKELSDHKPITLPGVVDGFQGSHDSDSSSGSVHYEIRILRMENRCLMLVGWGTGKTSNQSKVIQSGLDAIRVTSLKSLPSFHDSTEAQQKNMALCLHECGMAAHRRQEELQSASLFQEAFEISQDNPRTLESAAYTLRLTGQSATALTLLEKHADLFLNDASLEAIKGLLENDTGNKKGADRLLALFKKGHRNEDDLLATMQILFGHSRAEDAVKMVTKFLEKGGSSRVRRWQALAHDQTGDSKKALELMEKMLESPPVEVESEFCYGEIANNAEAYEKASKMVARLIKEGHDGPRTRMIAGWAQAGRKEWREAKASFEVADKSSPNTPLILDAIARASSALGEGDNSSLKTEIPALEIPASLQKDLAKAAAMPPADGASAQHLHRVTLLQYQKDKPLVTTIHRVTKILEAGAIPDFSTLTFPFDPLSENIYVNSLVVKNEDGSEAARLKPEEQYIVDESSQSAMATHRKILRIAVPGLKVGRTIHLVLTQREKSTDPLFPWQRMVFSSSLPCNLDATVVISPVGSFKVSGNSVFEKLANVTQSGNAWQATISPVPQFYNESSLPSIDTFLPVLHLGEAKGDWNQVGKDFLKDIEDRLKPEENITKLAHQLTDDLKSNAEKIQKLARHIQKEITYQGLEFGRRARRPNAASAVLSCHYGDCKDQSLLLHQLLAAIGIRSQLALVSSEHDVIDDLPTLDQFNHMIVHVPELKAKFIDTTGTYNPAGFLPPDLITQRAFVLDPEKPAIISFPERSTFPTDKISIQRDVTFDAKGAASVLENVSLGGTAGSGFRTSLAAVPQEQRLAQYQRFLRDGDTSQLVDLVIENLEETGEPLRLKLRYKTPASLGERRLPALTEATFLGMSFTPSRHLPFQIYQDLELESQTTFHAPEPLAKDSLAAYKDSRNTPFLKWSIESGQGDSLSFKGKKISGTHGASDYNAWYEGSQEVLRSLTKPLH